MDPAVRDAFLARWTKYFGQAALPAAIMYADRDEGPALVAPGSVNRCLVASMSRVLGGESMRFSVDSIGCAGGKRYCGFEGSLRPNFRFFLSYGIPGEVEGERYKKSPELVDEWVDRGPRVKAPGRFVVFKRWDRLDAGDDPLVVLFVAGPEALAGLFTLANFDEGLSQAVITTFGAGCSQMVMYPLIEQLSEKPRCVLGGFDVSARPYLPKNALTFAAPMKKFKAMTDNMDESFLVTESWAKVRKRIE